MNARERVLLALNHQEPDRVPIDLASTTVTSITFAAYDNLQAYLGIKDVHPRVSHLHQGIVYPNEMILGHYQADFRTVAMKKSPRGFVAKELPDGSFYDEYGILWKKGIYDYCPVAAPLIDCTASDLANLSTWPDLYDKERVNGLREEAKALYENTDFAIVADIIERGPFELAVKLRGYEQFLTDLYLDPHFATALLDKITETSLALWDQYLDAVGDYVQVVCQGDDLGMQTSLIISPEMYRRFIKPCHRRIYDFIHAKTKAKVFMHSCGAIYDIIPDLIEVGVDILNPLQRNAAKMDIVRLKEEFGRELCFWGGGIDVQQVLPNASLDAIETEIKRTLEILAPGGGYVFAPTHNIQPDITPERLDKLYRAALDHGRYPV